MNRLAAFARRQSVNTNLVFMLLNIGIAHIEPGMVRIKRVTNDESKIHDRAHDA
jgi:hypothetical protein